MHAASLLKAATEAAPAAGSVSRSSHRRRRGCRDSDRCGHARSKPRLVRCGPPGLRRLCICTATRRRERRLRSSEAPDVGEEPTRPGAVWQGRGDRLAAASERSASPSMSPNSDACGSGAGGGGMLPRSAVVRRAQPSSSSSSCDSFDSSRSSNGGSVAPISFYRGGGGSPGGECADRKENRALAPGAATTSLWLADSGADEVGPQGLPSCTAAADVGDGRSAVGAESVTASDVVSVPLSELEGLVARLRVAKAQMWDLKKIVDMQTSIILGLKATIRARHERHGGAEETGEPVPTCCGYESRSPRPNSISSTSTAPALLLPTPALPAAAAVTTVAASTTERRRPSHTDDLRRTIASAANAEVFCDRRPLSSDRVQSPSRPSPAGSGVGRVGVSVAVPQSRARTDSDSPCLAPASPPRTVAVTLERFASNLTTREAAAALTTAASAATRDDFGHRANLPSSVCSAASPYMFAARLPPAVSLSRPTPREELAYHRDAATPPQEEWSEAVPAAATACSAGGAVESSWSDGSAQDYAPRQLPAVGAARFAVVCHNRNGDPAVTGCERDDELQVRAPDATVGAVPAASAAAAVSVVGGRRCPFCRRAFAADVPVSDFQCHVLECDVSGEVVDATVGAAPTWAGGATLPAHVAPGGGGSDDDRTCPLCAAHYPAGVPPDEFEQHVLSHFQDE